MDKIIDKAINEHEKLTGQIPKLGKIVIKQVCKIALSFQNKEFAKWLKRTCLTGYDDYEDANGGGMGKEWRKYEELMKDVK